MVQTELYITEQIDHNDIKMQSATIVNSLPNDTNVYSIYSIDMYI